MNEPQLFTCRTCESELPAEEFRGDSRKRYGIIYECKECRRARMSTNGEYLRGRLRKYKKRSESSTMLITVEQLESLVASHSCAYCNEQLTSSNSTLDHIHALNCYGGTNLVENLVPVCRACNSSKGQDHVADFYRRSDKFTPELWQAFTRSYGSRLVGRELTELEGRQMARNLSTKPMI